MYIPSIKIQGVKYRSKGRFKTLSEAYAWMQRMSDLYSYVAKPYDGCAIMPASVAV